MFEFAVNILIGLVCLSELIYIVFRNPIVNHFNLPILLVTFTVQMIFLGMTSGNSLSSFIVAILIIAAAFLKWKYQHRAFEKPDWRYLIVLFSAVVALIFA